MKPIAVAIIASIYATVLVGLIASILHLELAALSIASIGLLFGAVWTAHVTLRRADGRLLPQVLACLSGGAGLWLIVGAREAGRHQYQTLLFGACGVASYFSSEILQRLRRKHG